MEHVATLQGVPQVERSRSHTIAFIVMVALLKNVLLSLSLASLAVAGTHDAPRRRHAGTRSLQPETALTKRYDNARFSYYEAGLGACGATNSDSDFVSFSRLQRSRLSMLSYVYL